jgi:catechol 2,3-dioxygenase-like lactoylglutathione lyase family enzyme
MPVLGVTAQIRTTNIAESIAFYTGIGLELEFRYEDFYAGIKAGDQSFHLKLVDEKDPSIDVVARDNHFHLYFETDDVEAMAQKLKEKGMAFHRETETTPWGTREFYIKDNQGHILCFAQEA